MPLLIRIAVAIILLCLMVFCVFGFAATYEPTTRNFLPWRIGYGMAIVACLGGAVWIVWKKPSS